MMKVLEDVHHRLSMELPRCKSSRDVELLLIEAKNALLQSKAPLGQKRRMWEDLRNNLDNLIRRQQIVNDAHSAIERIMKEIT
jgi:hypothetical protein